MPGGTKRQQPKRRKSKSNVSEVEPQELSKDKKTGKTLTLGSKKTPATVKPAPFDVDVAQEIIFQPNAGPQTRFLSATEQEVLYGGAAGGGKSYSLVADPVRYLNNPNASMLLVRRSTEELRELISV